MSRLVLDMESIVAPVEVRDEKLHLVKTGMTEQPLELPPGRYWATAVLPGGEVRSQGFVLGDDPLSVDLAGPSGAGAAGQLQSLPHVPEAPDLQARPPGRTVRGGGHFSFDLPPTTGAGDDAPADAGRWQIRIVSARTGRPADGVPGLSLPERDAGGDLGFLVDAGGTEEPLFAQIAREGALPLNVALPPGRLVVRVAHGERIEAVAEPGFRSPAATGVAAYLAAGQLDQAATLAETAEDLLHGKVEDPVAAAVGGYALLRLGRLEQLHDWPFNLADWFPWLPDGAVIAGELSAQRGDDTAAARCFSEAVTRGVPIFSDGLSYVARRAAQGLVGDSAAAGRLDALARLAEIGRLTVTVRAFDPTDPHAIESQEPDVGWTTFPEG